MGFKDKLKSAAQDIATQAKAATSQAQDKIEQAQTRKKMDEAARKLGYLVHGERTGGVPAGSEADQLIAEITSLKAELEATAAPSPSEDTQPPPAETP